MEIFQKLIFIFSLLRLVTAYDDPLVHLSYGSFLGKYNAEYNISYFRSIPYAAPPSGPNRFRAPQSPAPILNGTYNTDWAYPLCAQGVDLGSEDCLYLGLYSRPWSNSSHPKRPVLVFFHGGGFIRGGGSVVGIPPAMYPVLNVSETNDFIIVHPNYRVNAFGFLPGAKVKASSTSDLNCGLLDQQYALQWVRTHIAKFGGDPDNVTIWGQSAGGASVVAHVIANDGQTTPKLFNKVIASSPYWAKAYRYDSSEAEALYDQLTELTGCKSAVDTLQCLRDVDVRVIQNASMVISSKYKYTTSTFAWAPVIDGEFLRESLSTAVQQGRVNGAFVLSVYNTHEGENFVPPGLQNDTTRGGFNSTASSYNSWLKGFLPTVPEKSIQKIEKLYPPRGNAGVTLTYNDTFTRAGLVYRDLVLSCPGYWIALAANTEGRLTEYAIQPARHASDTSWWYSIQPQQESQPLIYRGFARMFAEFVMKDEPNPYAGSGRNGTIRVPVVETGRQLLVRENGFSTVEYSSLRSRCEGWMEMSRFVPV